MRSKVYTEDSEALPFFFGENEQGSVIEPDIGHRVIHYKDFHTLGHNNFTSKIQKRYEIIQEKLILSENKIGVF